MTESLGVTLDRMTRRAEEAERRLADLRGAANTLNRDAKALRQEVARGVAIRQSEESKLARADCLEVAASMIMRKANGE